MLINPTRTLRECGIELEISVAFIHTLVRSDSFKEVFNEVKKLHLFSVKEGLKGLASMSLEAIKGQIELYGISLKPETLRDYLDLALKYTEGSGSRQGNNGPAVVVQFQGITGDMLSEARRRMHAIDESQVEDIPFEKVEEHGPDGSTVSYPGRSLIEIED